MVKKKSYIILVICFITISFLFASSAYADDTKKRVDPEKFKKLTPEQKKEFIKKMKEARDTHLESVKAYEEILKSSEKNADIDAPKVNKILEPIANTLTGKEPGEKEDAKINLETLKGKTDTIDKMVKEYEEREQKRKEKKKKD